MNYKPLEQSFGPINKLFARETDILTLQEDKISYVLQGRTILQNPGAESSLMAVPEILGQQVARIEEFGISHNPESFVQWGGDKYFTDAKRGAVIQLKGTAFSNDQLTIVSNQGMRTWFRDLFNASFNTQKLGGFDPYMNEYVLTSNDIAIPEEVECKDCGITSSIEVVGADTVFNQCVQLGDLVGDVNIDYNVSSSSGTFEIEVIYNGITYTTGAVIVSGTLTFPKDIVNVSTAIINITTTNYVNLQFTINCPDAAEITIVLVTLTSNNEAGLHTTNQYRWSSGTFISPLHSDNIEFDYSATAPGVSQYDLIVGLQGGGIIPANGADVTMYNNTIGADDFSFNEYQDRFRHLRTNTIYPNTPVGINALLADSYISTPIIPPSSGNTAYYSEFPMPSVGTHLYLIWDYRERTPYELCYSNIDENVACCECTDMIGGNPVTIRIRDCNTGLEYDALIDSYFTTIGDVIQFKIGAGGGAGLVRCGTVISIGSVTPNATRVSAGVFDCGDTINCPVCTSYSIVTARNEFITYSYTDCDGNLVEGTSGSVESGVTVNVCAIYGTVSASGGTVTELGLC